MYYTVIYSAVLYCITLYCTYCYVLNWSTRYCTALLWCNLYWTMHCSALHCTALQCTAVHCIGVACSRPYCPVTYEVASSKHSQQCLDHKTHPLTDIWTAGAIKWPVCFSSFSKPPLFQRQSQFRKLCRVKISVEANPSVQQELLWNPPWLYICMKAQLIRTGLVLLSLIVYTQFTFL